MQIQYKKMSLFDAPGLIFHACNAQGVWGSGIAAEFKKRYPEEYKLYQEFCSKENMTSMAEIGEKTAWIVTSESYGKEKDNELQILINTVLALDELFYKASDPIYPWINKTLYCNKFNSGLFNVPWEKSEQILRTVLKKYPHFTVVVCDPDFKE